MCGSDGNDNDDHVADDRGPGALHIRGRVPAPRGDPVMNVYEIVTEKLVAALERGTVPWRRPWRGAACAPRNLASRKEYRGINALLLGIAGLRAAIRMLARTT